MASDYIVQTQTPTVQVLGPSSTIDVVQVGFTTVPHGVFAYANVPAEFYSKLGGEVAVDAFIEPLASLIERAMGIPGVIACRFEQDLSAAGLLVDSLVFTVSVTAQSPAQLGPMTADVTIPVVFFLDPNIAFESVKAQILAAQGVLDAIASL